jgi:hypothetical protein
MKTPEHERLLRDVLTTQEYAKFRADLAQQLRRQLNQRRFNPTMGYLALAASLVFLAVVVLRSPHRSGPLPHQLVRTSALDANSLVTTTPQNLIQVETVGLPQIVQTATDAHPISFLTDEQLLSLFPATPIVLVSSSSGHRELVFLSETGPQIFRPAGEDRASWQ